MVAFTEYAGDTRVRREAEALADRGDDVLVICLKDRQKPYAKTLNGVKIWRVPIKDLDGGGRIQYVVRYCCFFVLATFMLAFSHLSRRYDTVQVHTMPDFMIFTAIVPKLLGAKIVLDVHDLVPELYMSKFGVNAGATQVRLLTLIERISVGFADKAIAVSEDHLDVLVEHGNPREKFAVLLNVPDQKIFAPRYVVKTGDGHIFRILYHGTVEKRYGLEVALRAIAVVRLTTANVEMRVVGGGEDVPRLNALRKILT